jgi:hypothetical protein
MDNRSFVVFDGLRSSSWNRSFWRFLVLEYYTVTLISSTVQFEKSATQEALSQQQNSARYDLPC